MAPVAVPGPDKRHLATWLPASGKFTTGSIARDSEARAPIDPKPLGTLGLYTHCTLGNGTPRLRIPLHSTRRIGPNPIRPPKATAPQPRPRVLTAPSFGITGRLYRSLLAVAAALARAGWIGCVDDRAPPTRLAAESRLTIKD